MNRKKINKYTVLISGLKEGEHLFEFDINDSFFEAIDYSEVKKGKIKADVMVTKQSALVLLDFHLAGTVHINCDRCMDDFDFPIETKQRLVIKIDGNLEERDETEDEIIYFPGNEKEFDITTHLYEYLILALPIRRVHPDADKGESTCNPEVIKKLESLLINKENRKEDKTRIDPRWDALKKLKSNYKTQSNAKS